ncbi:MAG TPA: zf-HC2 domain-containing protein, partial [Planctomycetota bacterium]|nr:zf-HC2 domain-containing protein [Planctomycetota bacterium]
MDQDEHAACAELIPDYQAGELSPEDGARVDAHAQECEECASQLEEIQGVELEPSPRARLRERLLRSLPTPRRNPLMVRGVLAAAAIFFLGIVGYVLAEIDAPMRGSSEDQAIAEVLAADSPSAPALVAAERPRESVRGRSVPEMDRKSLPLDEPAVFFPESRASDHQESADGEDVHRMKSDSASFLSYIKGEAGGFRGRDSQGAYDTMGVGAGGGGGGRWGGRFGGREIPVARGGPTMATNSFQPAEAAREFREAALKAQQEPAAPPRAGRAPAAPPQDEAPRMPRKIIRSGEMEFEIDSFDNSVATLTKIAIEEQGFIATVNS